MTEIPSTTQAFCHRVLARGDLATKLAAPRTLDGALLPDDARAPVPEFGDRPVRDAQLEMSKGAGPLPAPAALRDPEARALCLARFAHHELQTVELFAWALLRWPELPSGLRRAWLATLEQEQQHCRLYLERLSAHGRSLSDYRHSDYFWKQAPSMAHAPEAFLAGVGLTLEQANLDFSLIYADAFRRVGDPESASVCERVHADEIQHVHLAHRWLRELLPSCRDTIERYETSVRFPLSAARAKARRFHVAPRLEAGLDAPFIEYVRVARSNQERRRGAGEPPAEAESPP